MPSILTLYSYNERVVKNLLSRASIKGLGDPGPGDPELRTIFEAAVRAPDHGKLRPWRFFVVRGDARRQLRSELMRREGVKRREPGATEAQIDKEREKPLRAPVTIAVVAKIVAGHKVPEIEQVLSTGSPQQWNIYLYGSRAGFRGEVGIRRELL